MSEDAQSVESVESVESGLLSAAKEEAPPAEGPAATAPTEPSEPTPWSWSEGINGQGEKPDWLQDRYKSVADQAKAYGELEKKFGEFTGAPKDGYLVDGIEGLSADDPMLAIFKDTFKDLNMSQKGFERVVSDYLQSQQAMAEADMKREMEKLGPQGQSRINQNMQWIKNNLSEDAQKAVATWIQTAEDLEAFESIRAFQPLSKSPGASEMTQSVTYESLQEVKNEKFKNWDKYQSDANYRNSLDQRMANAVRRSKKAG